MSYASKQQLIDRYSEAELIQLTDRAGAGVMDDGVLNAAMDEADAEINGYLEARYSLPLANVPLLVSKLARQLTRFNLYDDNPPDQVIERHKDAIKTLESIARGVVHLGLDSASKTTLEASAPATCADAPVFSNTTLAGYK